MGSRHASLKLSSLPCHPSHCIVSIEVLVVVAAVLCLFLWSLCVIINEPEPVTCQCDIQVLLLFL